MSYGRTAAEEAQKIADVQITEMQCAECGGQFVPVADQEWFDQSRAEYVAGALQGSPVYTYRNFLNQVPCNACAQIAFAELDDDEDDEDETHERPESLMGGSPSLDFDNEDEEPPF